MEIVAECEPMDTDVTQLSEGLEGCISAVDHIAIAVADICAARDWYTNKLGFKCVAERTTNGEHTGMLSAVLVAGSSVVVLVQGTEPSSQVSKFIDELGAGVHHVAFRVEDINAAMRRVTAAGGRADTPIIEGDGTRQVFLRREFGSAVRIELIERHGSGFSDRSVEELFRKFEQEDLY